MTNSNILHRGIVSRTGSNDREAYHVGYGRVMLSSGPISRFPAFGVDDLCKRGLAGVGHGCTLVGG